MKLLLDENLSERIVYKIIDLYPDSEHVKTSALTNTNDEIIWEYAKANNFVIVSKDSDFHQRSLLYGHPPKFIYLRIGNSPTSKIVQILRDNYDILIGVNLSRANLTLAELTGANLSGANLNKANLVGAQMTGVNLTKANLTAVNAIESALLENALLCGTTLPDGSVIVGPTYVDD